jgi:hypothetical protein
VAYSFGDCRSIQLSYGRTLWKSGSVSGPGGGITTGTFPEFPGTALALRPVVFHVNQEGSMADELDPKNENEEIGRANEDMTGSADEEEFEDIDEVEDDEEDLVS